MKRAPIREGSAKSGWAIRRHFEDSQSARIVAFSSRDRRGLTRGHRLAPVITLWRRWSSRDFFPENWSVMQRSSKKAFEFEAGVDFWGEWIADKSVAYYRLDPTPRCLCCLCVGGHCCQLLCSLAMCFLRSSVGKKSFSHWPLFLFFQFTIRNQIYTGCRYYQCTTEGPYNASQSSKI